MTLTLYISTFHLKKPSPGTSYSKVNVLVTHSLYSKHSISLTYSVCSVHATSPLLKRTHPFCLLRNFSDEEMYFWHIFILHLLHLSFLSFTLCFIQDNNFIFVLQITFVSETLRRHPSIGNFKNGTSVFLFLSPTALNLNNQCHFMQCQQCDQIGRFIGLWASF